MEKDNKIEQKATISPETGLTPQQEQACVMLASGEGYTAVATKLGINRGTLYRWQDNLAFRCFLNRQCRDYRDEVKNGLIGLHSEAVRAIKELLNSGSEATRLKAAVWVIERVVGVEVEETDIRKVLRDKATVMGWEEETVVFNKEAYKKSLKEYGLSELVK